MQVTEPFRRADCLLLLSNGPRVLPDDHRAIFWLLCNKHTLPIISTLVEPAVVVVDRLTKLPTIKRHPMRRWELLEGYTPEEVHAARIHGLAQAALIRDIADRKDWPAELEAIEHPIVRDSASDSLRGWGA